MRTGLELARTLSFASSVGAGCPPVDGLPTQHAEQNGVMDWRKPACAAAQHQEQCVALADQVRGWPCLLPCGSGGAAAPQSRPQAL